MSAIHQDRDGFIWFGTRNGLSRWDGKRFERFTTSQGLVDNDINSICEDEAGTLWFASRYRASRAGTDGDSTRSRSRGPGLQ